MSGQQTLPPPTITIHGNSAPVRVTLSHPDPAATIRYTLDGHAPTAKSPGYTGPIEITSPVTLRARAEREGFTPSIAASAMLLADE